jgi:hypothetical protein
MIFVTWKQRRDHTPYKPRTEVRGCVRATAPPGHHDSHRLPIPADHPSPTILVASSALSQIGQEHRAAGAGVAHAISPDVRCGHRALRSLDAGCAPGILPSLAANAGSIGMGNPSPSSAQATLTPARSRRRGIPGACLPTAPYGRTSTPGFPTPCGALGSMTTCRSRSNTTFPRRADRGSTSCSPETTGSATTASCSSSKPGARPMSPTCRSSSGHPTGAAGSRSIRASKPANTRA